MLGPAVLIYVLALTMLHAIGDLTLGYYGGFLLERRYGLSQQLRGAWLTDQAKSLVLTFVLGGAAISLVLLHHARRARTVVAGVRTALRAAAGRSREPRAGAAAAALLQRETAGA